VDLAKAGEDEVLEKFAADAASSYHQHTRLYPISIYILFPCHCSYHYLLDTVVQVPAEAPLRACFACHGDGDPEDGQLRGWWCGKAHDIRSWRACYRAGEGDRDE
jgi:hypothetical protein